MSNWGSKNGFCAYVPNFATRGQKLVSLISGRIMLLTFRKLNFARNKKPKISAYVAALSTCLVLPTYKNGHFWPPNPSVFKTQWILRKELPTFPICIPFYLSKGPKEVFFWQLSTSFSNTTSRPWFFDTLDFRFNNFFKVKLWNFYDPREYIYD